MSCKLLIALLMLASCTTNVDLDDTDTDTDSCPVCTADQIVCGDECLDLDPTYDTREIARIVAVCEAKPTCSDEE